MSLKKMNHLIWCMEMQSAGVSAFPQMQSAAAVPTGTGEEQMVIDRAVQSMDIREMKTPVQVYEFRLVTVPAQEIPVEREVIYEQMEVLAVIPNVQDFVFESEGRTAAVRCRADRKEAGAAWWSSDFSFPVTFHECDAEYCQLGDVLIPYNEEKPELDGYEHLLLNLIDVPQDAYRVTDVFWDGETYTDESGILCRDAKAVGEKLVRDHQVHYVGMAEFPAGQYWNITDAYGLELPETVGQEYSGRESIVSVETGEGTLDGDRSSEFWKNVIQTVTIAVSLLLIAVLIMIILVKRRKMRYTNNREDEHRREKE